MQKRRSRALAYYAGCAVLVAPLAMLVGWSGRNLGLPAALAAAGILFTGAHIAFLWYWRGLDETAQAAHKDAFFWGSLFASYLLGAAMLVLRFAPAAFEGYAAPAPMAFAHGLGAALLVIVSLAVVTWGVWWLRRR